MRKIVQRIFQKLDDWIEKQNELRRKEGNLLLSRSEITLLGQMSLLTNERVSALLHLVQTVDMDAFLQMEHEIKTKMKEILSEEGFIYDEDSHLVWAPPDSRIDLLFEFKNVAVKTIDPESALVSKAIKAPERNRHLIQEAIASGAFPSLIERIEKSGGNLASFLEKDHETQ
ncbi:MAG: hypothetical protein HY391_01180 [Deltaproteobacteria bacterium]|nr:hypothetical protein [Deltaproteobacteria bacterium]